MDIRDLMLAKCANPACAAPFRYLRDGRVYRVERPAGDDPRPGHNVEHFWLCGSCSAHLTLRVDDQGKVTVADKPGRHAA